MLRSAATVLTAVVSLVVMAPSSLWAYDPIEWAPSIAQAQQMATEQKRLVLIHFWSESCKPCMQLNKSVFNRREFVSSLHGNYIPVKVNVLEQPELAQQYQVRKIPTDVILTPDGKEVHRSISPADCDRYIGMLDEVAAHARLAMEPPPTTSLPLSNTSTIERDSPDATRVQPEASKQVIENPFARTAPAQQATPHPLYSQQAGGGASSASERPARQSQPQVQRNVPPQHTAPVNEANQNIQRRTVADVPEGNSQQPPAAPQGRRKSIYSDDSEVQRAAAQMPTHSEENVAQNNPVNNPQAATERAVLKPHTALQKSSQTNANVIPEQKRSPAAPMASPEGLQRPARNAAAPAPVGLDGYCPVSLVESRAWQLGDPRWQTVFQDRTYHFAGQAEMQQFLRDPVRFSPIMAGYDVVRYHEQKELVPGKREHGLFVQDQEGVTRGFYLFADEHSLEKFRRANEPAPAGGAR